jgi:hypothetical protein
MNNRLVKLVSMTTLILFVLGCQSEIFAKTEKGKFYIFLGASNNGEIGPCG